MTLLMKTRSLHHLLQQTGGKPFNFQEKAIGIKDAIQANIFMLDHQGKILSRTMLDHFPQVQEQEKSSELNFPTETNRRLLGINETKENMSSSEEILGSVAPSFMDHIMTIVPIVGGGDRLGTLLLTRIGQPFCEEDLILAEDAATLIGMQMFHVQIEKREAEARSKLVVSIAINSLSFSEMEAIEHIFAELDGKEGLLVASKVADRAGITRSVIVNALRKLESAGVIETRSLGMKGTFIRTLKFELLKELEARKVHQNHL